MTIIAMVILTQVGATLLAITITATLAATCVSSGYIAGLYTKPTLFPRYCGNWGR